MADPYFISRTRFVPAPPEPIFELLATPAMHPLFDGSDTVTGVQPNWPERLSAGAKFGMDMKIGAPYKIMNYVVEFEEGRRLGWRHFYGHVWRYILEPADGGTLVTEEWDAHRMRGRLGLRITGFTRRNPANIERTLENLAAHFSPAD